MIGWSFQNRRARRSRTRGMGVMVVLMGAMLGLLSMMALVQALGVSAKVQTMVVQKQSVTQSLEAARFVVAHSKACRSAFQPLGHPKEHTIRFDPFGGLSMDLANLNTAYSVPLEALHFGNDPDPVIKLHQRLEGGLEVIAIDLTFDNFTYPNPDDLKAAIKLNMTSGLSNTADTLISQTAYTSYSGATVSFDSANYALNQYPVRIRIKVQKAKTGQVYDTAELGDVANTQTDSNMVRRLQNLSFHVLTDVSATPNHNVVGCLPLNTSSS